MSIPAIEKKDREVRVLEIRAAPQQGEEDQGMVVEGRAIVFNSPTVMWEYDGVKYYEVIDSKALDGTDMTDVVFRYNHLESMFIMARTRKGSLELNKSDQGLDIRAKLFDISQARDLYTLIQAGAIDQMSFAFSVEEDSYNRDTHTRTILKIKKLYDVAAVDTGAYSDKTSITARSFFELEREKDKKAAEAAERRRKLALQTYL